MSEPLVKKESPHQTSRLPDDGELLSVKNLSVAFRTARGSLAALQDVSFDVSKGEVVGLVGESGCGKSVTALSILRLLAPPPATRVSGRVMLGDVDLNELSTKEMRKVRGGSISMIFQEPLSALNPVLTIGDQVGEVYRVHQAAGRRHSRRLASEMLAQVGLTDPSRRMRQYPHELSGGMRQRVLIAMALACRPNLLLADEPTTALDVTVQAQILQLLKSLQQELDLSVLFITHDLGVVAEICHRVVVLYAGRVVEVAPTKQLFQAAAHPYTRGLLSCLPEAAGADGADRGARSLQEMEGRLPDPFNRPLGCLFSPRCPRATDACHRQEPALEEIDGVATIRKVRCFHPHPIEP